MKKNNFFKNLVCFLAVWSAILVSIFLGFEIWEMIKTFVANIPAAFNLVTKGDVVFFAMIASIFAAIMYSIVRSVKEKAKEVEEVSKQEEKDLKKTKKKSKEVEET